MSLPGMAMSMENSLSSVSCSMVMGTPRLRRHLATSLWSWLMRTLRQAADHCACARSSRPGGVPSRAPGLSTCINRYDCGSAAAASATR